MCNQLIFLSLLVATIGSTLAGDVNFTECSDNGTFDIDYLDIEGCDGSDCNITAGQTYAVEFAGCYNGTVSPITKIPFSVKGGFGGINLLPIKSGDLCQSFTSDSETTACPAVVPQPDGACGKWLINVKVPLFDLGVIPELGLPGTVRASAYANTRFSTPVLCVEFPVKYFTL